MHNIWFIRFLNLINRASIKSFGEYNQIQLNSVRLIRSNIHVKGRNNRVVIGKGTRLVDSTITLHGDYNCIEIGQGSILGELSLTVLSCSNSVLIGSSCTSSSVRIMSLESNTTISIGNDCMISHNVEILCSDSHSIIDLSTGLRVNPSKNIFIDDHVWLGANCAVLKGSSIGKDSVIGFRSVVTGNLPASSICVGAPASVRKSGITWNRDLF